MTDADDTAKALADARDWLGYSTRFGIVAEVEQGAVTEEQMANVARALLSLHTRVESMAAVVAAAEEWADVEPDSDVNDPACIALGRAVIAYRHAALDGYRGAK